MLYARNMFCTESRLAYVVTDTYGDSIRIDGDNQCRAPSET